MESEEAVIEIDGQEAGVIALAEIIQALHSKWSPHPGQVPLGWALFYGGFKDIFAQCGRSWGKTEFIAYALWRYALERTKSENYCFGPLAKQVREILWAPGRIQGLGPEEYKSSINNTEMRIILNNESFIKLDGSDNIDAYRGIKPKGLSVYDELKDLKSEFINAYDPNRAAHDSPAIYIGTPPEFHNHFVDLAEKARKYHLKTWFFLHAPTRDNPYNSKRWLDNKKAELLDAGDEETWLREYEAIYVKGGKRHIIPQALKMTKVPLKESLPKDLHNWTLVVHNDPATTSTFGVLFSIYNPYSKQVKLVDEIYEQTMSEMTTGRIWAKIDEKVAEWVARGVDLTKIQYGYDEAAAWFMNETTEARPGRWLIPTEKHELGREQGISLLRDVFNRKLIEITDNVPKLSWELENYIKDEKGKVPKKNDHQIDNLIYTLYLLGYRMEEEKPPKEIPPQMARRGYSMEEDMSEQFGLMEVGGDGLAWSNDENGLW